MIPLTFALILSLIYIYIQRRMLNECEQAWFSSDDGREFDDEQVLYWMRPVVDVGG